MYRKTPRPATNRPLLERTTALVSAGGRAVLHLRSPYDSIVSWYNHVLSGDAYGEGLPVEELNEKLSSAHFCSFAEAEAREWFNLVADWATSGHHMIVTTHEAFLEDAEQELDRLAKFLKVPLESRRLSCLGKHPMTRHRRPGQATTERI